jgi:hypothetical protein
MCNGSQQAVLPSLFFCRGFLAWCAPCFPCQLPCSTGEMQHGKVSHACCSAGMLPSCMSSHELDTKHACMKPPHYSSTVACVDIDQLLVACAAAHDCHVHACFNCSRSLTPWRPSVMAAPHWSACAPAQPMPRSSGAGTRLCTSHCYTKRLQVQCSFPIHIFPDIFLGCWRFAHCPKMVLRTAHATWVFMQQQ